jgi:aspartyl-tRNA synthetase
MVSKKEFLDMMAKAYDMKANGNEVGQGRHMTEQQMKDFLKSLYVGG